MAFLGLRIEIWAVLALYLAGMLALGWRSRREAKGREGYMMGKRQFGVSMMVMHAFGAGTHPGDVAGVVSGAVRSGPSGIWISWMWMFGTPFYWLIGAVVRRMRCLTLADYFEERFGRRAAVLYTIIATVGMTICAASCLLATTRTVQGMMSKIPPSVSPVEAEAWFFGILFVTTAVFVAYSHWGGIVATIRTDFVQGLMMVLLSFLAIPAALGLRDVAGWSGTVRTLNGGWVCEARGEKFILKGLGESQGKRQWRLETKGQGFLLEAPAGSPESHSWELDVRGEKVRLTARRDASGVTLWELEAGGERHSLKGLGRKKGTYLDLFDPAQFSLLAVLALCINAPFSILAQPHLMTMCGAGRTEWEGRMGFTYGAMLKRVCTMGWCVLALCWVAYLFNTTPQWQQPTKEMADSAFGDSVQKLLPVVLQGVMLACVLAAGMSTGSAIQVTVAALFSQSIYRHYIRPDADEERLVWVTRLAGIAIIAAAMLVAIPMRHSVVEAILDFFNLTAVAGIAVGMGILWRRMNSVGVFSSILAAAAVFLVTRVLISWDAASLAQQGLVSLGDGRPAWAADAGVLKWLADHELLGWVQYVPPRLPEPKWMLECTRVTTICLPLLTGIVAGIVGSLLSRPPKPETIEGFFKKIYVPIGQEAKLNLPLDEAVPPSQRLLTAGGLFIVKPSRQSWVGFLVALGVCLALVGIMVLLLRS